MYITLMQNSSSQTRPETSPEPSCNVVTKCPFGQKEQIITVPRVGYQAWRRGALIQNALPKLSADEREALISGICSNCLPSDEE